MVELVSVIPSDTVRSDSVADHLQGVGLFGKKKKENEEKRKEPLYKVSDLQSEFLVPPPGEAKSLVIALDANPIESLKAEEAQEKEESVTRELEYLAITQDAEFDSERTQILERYAKEMLEGETYGGEVRVVILRRGLLKRGFVFPDGTICLSQELINKCGTFSGVLAVLAHEVAHLINGTHFVKKASQSIGWLHEQLGSDADTPRLLNKIGVNTMIVHDVFERFAVDDNNMRGGLDHSSSQIRAANALIDHQLVNRAHSQAPTIALDEVPSLSGEGVIDFSREKILPTHLELMELAINDQVEGTFSEFLGKLSVRDLAKAYSRARYQNIPESDQVRLNNEIALFTRKRLNAAGVPALEQNCFLVAHRMGSKHWNEVLFANLSYQDYIDILKHGPHIPSSRWDELHKTLFGQVLTIQERRSLDEMHVLQDNIKHEVRDRIIDTLLEKSVPVEEEVFLQLIEAYQHLSKRNNEDKQLIEMFCFPNFIAKYVINTFYQNERFNLDGLEAFLYKLKDLGYVANTEVGPALTYDLRDRGGLEDTSVATAEKIIKENVAPTFEKIFGEPVFKQAEKIEKYKPITLEKLRSQLDEIFSKKDGHELYYAFLELHDPLFYGAHLCDAQDMSHQELVEYFLPLVREVQQRVKIANLEGLLFNQALEDKANYRTNRTTKTRFTKTDQDEINPTSLRMRLELQSLVMEKYILEYSRDKATFADRSALAREKLISFDTRFGDEYPFLATEDLHISLHYFAGLFTGESDFKLGEELLNSRLLQVIEQRISQDYHFDTIENFTTSMEALRELAAQIRESFVREKGHYWPSVLDSNFASLIFNRIIDKKFMELLEASSDIEKIPQLIPFIESHLSSAANYVDTNPITRKKLYQLKVAYLRSAEGRPELLLSRIDYFLENFEDFTYQDILSLMRQIHTYSDAAYLLDGLGDERVKLLRGETKQKKSDSLAVVDLYVSLFKNKKRILETIDTDRTVSSKNTTDFVVGWLDKFNQETESPTRTGINYNRDTKHVEIDQLKEGGRFSTAADIISLLQSLSAESRKSLAMRLLLDSDGLLSSEENRVWLADLVIKVFEIEDDFVRNTAKGFILRGKPTVIGLALSDLIGPLLFSGLSLKEVDYGHIRESRFPKPSGNGITQLLQRNNRVLKNGLSFSDLPRLLGQSKQEATDAGNVLKNYDDIPTVKSAYAKVGERHARVLDWMDEMITQYPETKGKAEQQTGEKITLSKQKNEISPKTEALIRTLENMGGLFVRSIQIGRLIHTFSPNMARRLSNSFDRMQGTDEFKFWLNIYESVKEDKRLRERGERDDEGVTVTQFIEEHLASVEKFVGGGSLASTYRGKLRKDLADIYGFEDVAIKILTANVGGFVKLGAEAAMAALEYVEEHGNKRSKGYARLAKVGLQVSQAWCQEDIKEEDPENTRVLRGSIHRFAEKSGEKIITAEAVFAAPHNHIRVEEFLSGETLNQYLQDPEVETYLREHTVPFDESDFTEWLDKQGALTPKVRATLIALRRTHLLSDHFFVDRPKISNGRVIKAQDPHPGNFLIDVERNALGAIDLPPNFTFTDKETDVFNILREGNYVEFLKAFISLVVEYNQKKNPQAPSQVAKINRAITTELTKEFVRNSLIGDKAEVNYVQKILNVFVKYDQKIPWEWFVEIRNINNTNKERGRGGVKIRLMEVLLKKLRERP